jgi:cytochrome P450
MLSVGGQMARDNLRFIAYSKSQIAKRKLAEEQALASGKPLRKDFVHYLLSASDHLTKEELDADSGLLVSAGADTTSVTLAALLFYLIHKPSALAQATEEVRAAFTDVEEIASGPKLTSLVYTRSCIEEALRLSPPVTAHLPREVLAGGLTIDGHFFPKGTIVGTSAYAIHHNPEYYPEPFAFKPERWIASTSASPSSSTAEKDDSCTRTGTRVVTAEDVATAKAAFCAFSLGTRGCVGKSVAYLELMLAAARMLWLFDIRRPERAGSLGPTGEGDPGSVEEGRKRVDEYQLRDAFLSGRKGPMVEFRRRVEGRVCRML